GGATITWDIVVGGWDLEYTAKFVSNAEESYAIVVEKPRKLKAADEAVCNSDWPKLFIPCCVLGAGRL
ncbi:unnamed protein product, partial [Brassica rapa]